nr:MAG TPA: hypothetical protein [Caudoviricetes sp.]
MPAARAGKDAVNGFPRTRGGDPSMLFGGKV